MLNPAFSVSRAFPGSASRQRDGWSRAGRSLVAAVIIGLPAVVSLAAAGPAAAAPTGGPVIVGPLLDFFAFGANIGAPLVCGTATSAIGDGASEYGLAQGGSVIVNAINQGCASFSQYGAQFVAMGQASDSPLNQLNPLLNPVLESAANSFPQIAQTFGSSLNPFGPTIAGLGATFRWFEGS